MNSYYLKKLVRDNSSENMQASGATVVSRVLGEREFLEKLVEKMQEEAHELAAAKTPQEQAEELADILELVDVYLETQKISLEDIRRLQIKKRHARGSFGKREFVEYIDTPKGSKYDIYCAAAPDKYPLKKD